MHFGTLRNFFIFIVDSLVARTVDSSNGKNIKIGPQTLKILAFV